MFRSVSSLLGRTVLATDGKIGNVDDLFFDDKSWSTAYLVVKFNGRSVLLPPTALGKPDWDRNQFPVAYSKEQIANSPDIDLDKPVSRQREAELYSYFGWVPYWNPESAIGAVAVPLIHTKSVGPEITHPSEEDDPHLFSLKELLRYTIEASDERLGHVGDIIVEDPTWKIHFIVLDMMQLFTEKKFLLPVRCTRSIAWDEQKVYMNCTLEKAKNGPFYDPSLPLSIKYTARIHDYYR